MTVGRAVALLLVFVGVAVWRVHLRTEETRLTARIQALRAERAVLRRGAWALQLEAARLRTPEQIRVRADRWHLDVQAPWLDCVNIEQGRLAVR